jgi:hypothetical protein
MKVDDVELKDFTLDRASDARRLENVILSSGKIAQVSETSNSDS